MPAVAKRMAIIDAFVIVYLDNKMLNGVNKDYWVGKYVVKL